MLIMEKLQIQVEALERKRSKWLIINLIGFCIWDGLRIIENYVLVNTVSPLRTGVMLLGGLIWMVALIKLLRLGNDMKGNKYLVQILNDELIELNRYKVWRASLLMVILTQVLIIIATFFVADISGILAAELSIFVFVTSALGGFSYFNK